MKDLRGWNCVETYEYYVEYAKKNGFKICASNVFGSKIREYVERKRVRFNGKLEWRYIIKENVKIDVVDDDKVDIDLDEIEDVHI